MAIQKLIIGFQTENNANNLSIDISQLKARFPSATPQLWAIRPGETKADAYPVPKQSVSGNNLIWTPLAVDVDKNGDGEAQVRMYDTSGTEIIEARSEIIPTVIQRSIIPSGASGDVPAVVASYAQMVTDAMNNVMDDLVDAAAAEAKQEIEDKGAATLQTIPAKYSAVYNAAYSFWRDTSFQRTGKIYGVSFNNTTKANVGTRLEDAVDMVANPSTDTVKGVNDFDRVPIFNSIRANGYLDEDGEFVLTAVEGDPLFSLYGDNGDVWVLFKTCYFKIEFGETEDRWYVSDESHGTGWFVSPGAVRPDGSVRPFIPIAAYRGSDDGNGVPVSVSGKSPLHHISHNSQLSALRTKKGEQYAGMTSKDMFHLSALMTIEYATRNEKSVVYGCLSYNFQYPAAVEEEGVERFILTSAQAANIIVGSCVSIGHQAIASGKTTIDRNYAALHEIADRVIVTKKEAVGSNVAIYVDHGGITFNVKTVQTTSSGTAYDVLPYITTMPWHTGNTDTVLGPTGSPGDLHNGRYDMRYRYVETVWGNQYVVLSDEIHRGEKLYICDDCKKFATSLTSDYEQISYDLPTDHPATWGWAERLGFDPSHPSAIEPVADNASSTTGYCAGFYMPEDTTSLFAVWAGCVLNGSSPGGPRARFLGGGLAYAYWGSALRLSATGRCGRVEPAA